MTIHCRSFAWTSPADFRADDLPLTEEADLVVLFASGDVRQSWAPVLEWISGAYSKALVVGCSSAGEIMDGSVRDDALVGMALSFESSSVRGARVAIDQSGTPAAAAKLVGELAGEQLRYVLVLSDGLTVNGSELAAAMSAGLPDDVVVTGGLAGDGARFNETCVFYDGEILNNAIVAVGLYGERLRVGHGSLGGWDPFGPTRTVTRSTGNILYELDGQSALQLYKKYLGAFAGDLPASGLLFPLSISAANGEHELVRTLLAVDEETQSMTFAGDIPTGTRAKLMKANFDRLVDGAMSAAQQTRGRLGTDASVALLISCVGRKMVLGERIEEEVDAVREVLGKEVATIGFYSYGELSPISNGSCELHNQTMTITTLSEF